MRKYDEGTRVSGRCVTTFAEHTGPVVRCEPDAFYRDGAPRGYRTVIRSESTGREVILWTGTEREVRTSLAELVARAQNRSDTDPTWRTDYGY